MRYIKQGLFHVGAPITAAFLNNLEDFLVSLSSEKPHQRCGPFVVGQTFRDGSFLNSVEAFLSERGGDMSYEKRGPFMNGTVTWQQFCAVVDHIEDFLCSLEEEKAR